MLPVYKESCICYTTPSGNVQVILYQRKVHQKQREKIYYIKQKLSGLILITVGIICPILLNGDATASLFILPLGVYLMLTKEKVMIS